MAGVGGIGRISARAGGGRGGAARLRNPRPRPKTSRAPPPDLPDGATSLRSHPHRLFVVAHSIARHAQAIGRWGSEAASPPLGAFLTNASPTNARAAMMKFAAAMAILGAAQAQFSPETQMVRPSTVRSLCARVGRPVPGLAQPSARELTSSRVFCRTANTTSPTRRRARLPSTAVTTTSRSSLRSTLPSTARSTGTASPSRSRRRSSTPGTTVP